MERKEIRRTDITSRELRLIEYIGGVQTRLELGDPDLEKRIKSVPDLWRQWRIATVAIAKVLDGLYDTMPHRALERMQVLCERGEWVLRPKSPINKRTDSEIILEKDFNVLVNTAMSARCAFCMNDGKAIKECELRKVLLNVAPPNKLDSNSTLCPYAQVALENDLGNYI